MAKEDPRKEADKEISIGARAFKELAADIKKKIDADINAREGAIEKMVRWYKRRYQNANKNPIYPWPGSSDFNPPLIDSEINKRKSAYMDLFNADPIVTFIPQNPRSKEKAISAQHLMQWLLTTRMRDFKDNMEIGIDHMLMYGQCVFKITYEWESKVVTETYKKQDMDPDILNGLVQAFTIANQNPELQEQFDENFDKSFLLNQFGIDIEDPVDKVAAKKIEKWLLGEDEEVTIKRNKVCRDAPYVYPVDPAFFVPENGACDIQEAERVTEIKFLSENDIMIRAKSGYFDEKAAKRVLKQLGKKDITGRQVSSARSQSLNLETEKAIREGIKAPNIEQPKDIIEIWEVYMLFDIDGDGVKEKVQVIYQPHTQEMLKFIEFPYANDKWPYVVIPYEKTDTRFDSPRGVPEILDQIDLEITFNHRAKANRMTIANAPTFTVRRTANINPNNIQWVPGQLIPVREHTDFQPVVMPNLDASSDNEELILRSWAENLLGSTDFALTRPQSLSEPRTRAEIEAILSIGSQVMANNLRRFQRKMKEVYDMNWDLWMQYGPDEVSIPMSGGMVRKITRHQIMGDFDIVPMGTTGNIPSSQQAQQALSNLQMLIQLKQNGIEQLTDFAVEIDLHAALLDYFNKVDYVTARSIIRTREENERNAMLQQQQQQQALVQAAERNEPLTEDQLSEVSKVLPFGKSQRVAR